jgi:hypothetical protein
MGDCLDAKPDGSAAMRLLTHRTGFALKGDLQIKKMLLLMPDEDVHPGIVWNFYRSRGVCPR